jgi:hypothetical protein
MFLTKDEIAEMTGRVQRRAQARDLNALGVTHKIRADGSLLVLRLHVEQLLGARIKAKSERPDFTPNWDAANS